MNAPHAVRVEWSAMGAQITLPPDDKTPQVRTERLTHAEIAALTNYQALALGLPPAMEAMIVLTIEGRIDVPQFRVTHSIEPFFHQHPWAVYTRLGARLTVGERAMRLNPVQLEVLNALDALNAAGPDIAHRLLAWSTLSAALHRPGKHHVLVATDFPRYRIQQVDHFPITAMTRIGKQLSHASDIPHALWAMEAGRRYYVRTLENA